MLYAKFASPWGPMTAGIRDSGSLSGLWFDGQKYFPILSGTERWIDETTAPNQGLRDLLRMVREQLEGYAEGRLWQFSLPLAPEGTPFRKAVWRELLAIPHGATATYGQIGARVAAALGTSSMAGQAIGGAVGHNPLSIIIPCHRVVGSDGSLTGYAGGLSVKAALLEHERTCPMARRSAG